MTRRGAALLSVSFRNSETTSPENPEDVFHRRHTRLYVEKRLGNIGLLPVLSDASMLLLLLRLCRNGRCIPLLASPQSSRATAG